VPLPGARRGTTTLQPPRAWARTAAIRHPQGRCRDAGRQRASRAV